MHESECNSFTKMIGTAISLENSAMISYPSVSVCSEDDRAYVAFKDREDEGLDSPVLGLFDSWESAEAYAETNVRKPYVIPNSPDMAKLFTGIVQNGPNGTKFQFNPRKHIENRDVLLSYTWSDI